MAKNKKTTRNNNNKDYEDRYDLRKSVKRKRNSGRKKDKKYLRDMLDGDIDIDDFHEYNERER